MGNYTYQSHGFEEIEKLEGMTNAEGYSAKCSGGRSDCCTRICEKKVEIVASEEVWTQFLEVQGGQIQY